MATENVKSRKAYRILTDPINKVWDRINLLTNAQSVDADDGQNLETKVGKIKGITKDTNVAQEGYAADATVIKALNDSLGGITKFIVDPVSHKITGYTTKGGADTVFPFKGSSELTTPGYYISDQELTTTELIANTINFSSAKDIFAVVNIDGLGFTTVTIQDVYYIAMITTDGRLEFITDVSTQKEVTHNLTENTKYVIVYRHYTNNSRVSIVRFG